MKKESTLKTVIYPLLFLMCFVLYTTSSQAWNKPKIKALAKSATGKILRIIHSCPGEGGCSLSYEVVDSDGTQLKYFGVSSDFTPEGNGGRENISVEECKHALNELKTTVHEMKFSGVKIDVQACEGNRWDSVRVNTVKNSCN